MSKCYCKFCGNSLLFYKVVSGTIEFPVCFEETEEGEEYEELGAPDVTEVFDEYYKCGECGHDIIEREGDEDNDEIL